jgi:hypothetical protein
MAAAWGRPAAAVDVDQLYLNVDAKWELPYDRRRNAMVLEQASGLVLSLFNHGWLTVMVCGNSLFDATDTEPLLRVLGPVAGVYHVTLTPNLEALLRRCDGSGRDASRLSADFNIHKLKRHPHTALLDNTDLTAEEALARIAVIVGSGVGRLPCPLGPADT